MVEDRHLGVSQASSSFKRTDPPLRVGVGLPAATWRTCSRASGGAPIRRPGSTGTETPFTQEPSVPAQPSCERARCAGVGVGGSRREHQQRGSGGEASQRAAEGLSRACQLQRWPRGADFERRLQGSSAAASGYKRRTSTDPSGLHTEIRRPPRLPLGIRLARSYQLSLELGTRDGRAPGSILKMPHY